MTAIDRLPPASLHFTVRFISTIECALLPRLVCARYFVHTMIPRAEPGSECGAIELQTTQAGRLRKDIAGEGRLLLVEEEALNVGKEAL